MSVREVVGTRERETTAVGRSSYYFGVLLLVLILSLRKLWGFSISEEVVGFSPFMVSPRKNTVFIVFCV